jgi:hypothetical protein
LFSVGLELDSATLWRIALFYYRVNFFFSLFDFVYKINLKNKPLSLMPNDMPMINVACFTREI